MARGHSKPHGRGLALLDKFHFLFNAFRIKPAREDGYFKFVKRKRNKGADHAANLAISNGNFHQTEVNPSDFLRVSQNHHDPLVSFILLFKTDGGFKHASSTASIGIVAYGIKTDSKRIIERTRLVVAGQVVASGVMQSGDAELDAIDHASTLLQTWVTEAFTY